MYEDIFGKDAVKSKKARVVLFDRDGEDLFGFTAEVDVKRIVGVDKGLARFAQKLHFCSSSQPLSALVMHELVEAELERFKLEVAKDKEGRERIIIQIKGKEKLADMLNNLLENLTDPAAKSLYKMAISKLKEGGKDSQEKARHYLSVAVVSEMMPDANRELTAYIYTKIGKRLGEFLEKTLLVEGIDEGVFGVFAEEYKGLINDIKNLDQEDKPIQEGNAIMVNRVGIHEELLSAISKEDSDAILQFVQENIADISVDTENVKRFKADVENIVEYYKNDNLNLKGAAFLVIDSIFRHNIMPIADTDIDDEAAEAMAENRADLASSVPLLLAQTALHAIAYMPAMQIDYDDIERVMSIRAKLMKGQSMPQEDIHPDKAGGIDLSLMRLVPVSLGSI